MQQLSLSISIGGPPLARDALRAVDLRDVRPLAEAIVNSAPVIAVFGSCEFDELSSDGQLWIAAIVRESIAFASAARI